MKTANWRTLSSSLSQLNPGTASEICANLLMSKKSFLIDSPTPGCLTLTATCFTEGCFFFHIFFFFYEPE
jgi:hypothetical protein